MKLLGHFIKAVKDIMLISKILHVSKTGVLAKQTYSLSRSMGLKFNAFEHGNLCYTFHNHLLSIISLRCCIKQAFSFYCIAGLALVVYPKVFDFIQ